MASWRRLGKYAIFSLFALILLYSLFVFLFLESGALGCGHRTVLVTGRLIDGRTGRPLGGVYVMSLAVRAWAEDAELIARYRAWNAESAAFRSEEVKKGDWSWAGALNASTTTREDGTFTLVLRVPCSTRTCGFLAIEHRSGYEPRNGAEILRVEVLGRPPVNVEIPHGVWVERGNEEGTDVHWYWGDVRVP